MFAFPRRCSLFRPFWLLVLVVGWTLLYPNSDVYASAAETVEWAWRGGNAYTPLAPVYGDLAQPHPANRPGPREGAASWIDSEGNVWLFGGYVNTGSAEGPLNDLWKRDPTTGHWTWVSGSNTTGQIGSYMHFGGAHPENQPGARSGAVAWHDATGGLWLFGGSGIGQSGGGYFNDLWRFDIDAGQWAWIAGSNDVNQTATFGEKGSPDDSNRPGARYDATGWIDASGDLWLFGGNGRNDSQWGTLADLWRFDVSTSRWTWMAGSPNVNQAGNYGTPQTPHEDNFPGSRQGSVAWLGPQGNLWLFGGTGHGESGSGRLNDLWRYDTNYGEWTWISGSPDPDQIGVYGTQGEPNPANYPGSRTVAVLWKTGDAQVWLFGGEGYGASGPGPLNDLWRYEIGTDEWTWISGSSLPDQLGTYGPLGEFGDTYTPGSRTNAVAWVNPEGQLNLYTGHGYNAHALSYLNDLWQFDTATHHWAWLFGDASTLLGGIYGELGQPHPANWPGARLSALAWSGTSGESWLFGGEGYDTTNIGYLNDLWRLDAASGQWTWVSGGNTADQPGIYVAYGDEEIAIHPGSRIRSAGWADNTGQFWLFGGIGQSETGAGSLNDLWRYNPQSGEWAWISGANTPNQLGVYGSVGQSNPLNHPGARDGAITWNDSQGNLWLFGGTGYAASLTGLLNDLWKFDPITQEWLWLTGNSAPNHTGNYGPLGVAQSDYRPGARTLATGWQDAHGDFWLFGGYGYGKTQQGFLNDLWHFSPATNMWRWMGGHDEPNQAGSYGTPHQADAGNWPGARLSSNSWTDEYGRTWLFGGNGYSAAGPGDLNDLWLFSPTAPHWIWSAGSSEPAQLGVYGNPGEPGDGNTPGARAGSVGWPGPDNSYLIFGGTGYSASGSGLLNDLWQVNLPISQILLAGLELSFGTLSPAFDPGITDYLVNLPASVSNLIITPTANLPGAVIYFDEQLITSGTEIGPLAIPFGESAFTFRIPGLENDTIYTLTVHRASHAPTVQLAVSPQLSLYSGIVRLTAHIFSSGGWPTGQVAFYSDDVLLGASPLLGGVAVLTLPTLPVGAYTFHATYAGDNSHTPAQSPFIAHTVEEIPPDSILWSWEGGSAYLPRHPVFGDRGQSASKNTPGALQNPTTWTDLSGNMWLFGGMGASGDATDAYLSDLWHYNAHSEQWTWLNGSGLGYQPPVYGELGVPHPDNRPGGRESAVGWTDLEGNLWLFGGSGTTSQGWAYLGDLWRYDVAAGLWTWMGGSDSPNPAANYGAPGIANVNNRPGGRAYAVSWADSQGNFWLFGGEGHTATETGRLNDLWRYEPATQRWTWVGGSDGVNQTGVYETPSMPGARRGAVGWRTPEGDLWLFGGYGYAATGQAGLLSDLWHYAVGTGQWTWIDGPDTTGHVGNFGSRGIANAANRPGSRHLAAGWLDYTGGLWLFGGYGYDASTPGYLNDLWRYDTGTQLWTWMAGDQAVNQPVSHPEPGLPHPDNSPAARFASAGWADIHGNFWLFGGYASVTASTQAALNDLWYFAIDTGHWQWRRGDTTISPAGHFGAQGTPHPDNYPAPRAASMSWTDAEGNIWLFGGYSSSASAYLNDLWRYDPVSRLWTWMSGSPLANQPGTYGDLLISHPDNQPGGRQGAIGWVDAQGLWLFGGLDIDDAGATGRLNDLWRYDLATGLWTWMGGSRLVNPSGVYANSEETLWPGGRSDAAGWLDNAGNFWLFGGLGFDHSGSPGNLNDLWHYATDVGSWSWIGGSTSIGQAGVYEAPGQIPPALWPGARRAAATWIDVQDRLWLFGGNGSAVVGTGSLNDFWYYETSIGEWTWIGGSQEPDQTGEYGARGIGDAGNMPGARQSAAVWTDNDSIWMFGGEGYAATGNGVLNDLWRYEMDANAWTWMSGSDRANQSAATLGLGITSPDNTPGGRYSAAGWVDHTGSLWLLGGQGYAVNGNRTLDDLWVARPALIDDHLISLDISAGVLEPQFSPQIHAYMLTVPGIVNSLSLTMTTGQTDSTLTVNNIPVVAGAPAGPFPLAFGNNSLTIGVTAAAGQRTDYSLDITRGPYATSIALEVNDNPILFGTLAVVTATVTTGAVMPSGTVAFYADELLLDSLPLVGGSASLSLEALQTGSYTLMAEFIGDANFSGSTSELLPLVVVPAPATVTLHADPTSPIYGQTVELIAGVASSIAVPTGTIRFYHAGDLLDELSLVDGQASLLVNTLVAGTHQFTATYSGATNYSPATSSVLNLEVEPAAAAIQLQIEPNPTIYGTPTHMTATVTSLAGLPSGTLDFYLNGTLHAALPLEEGLASLQAPMLPVGTHVFSATYSGSSDFLPAVSSAIEQQIATAPTQIVVQPAVDISAFGASLPITLHVSAPHSVPGGHVTLFSNGETLDSAQLIDGEALLTINGLPVATHTFTATYSGDTNHAAAIASPVFHTVERATSVLALSADTATSTFGQTIRVTATIPTPVGTYPLGEIDFYANGNFAESSTLHQGVAAIEFNSLPAATYYFTATYPGDDNFTDSTSSLLPHIVQPAPIEIQLESNPQSSIFGQSFTVTATVTSFAGTPPGSVRLYAGGILLAEVPLDSGRAVRSVDSLAAGTHPLTVLYSGATNFAASASSVLTQTVQPAPTHVSLGANPTPGVFGQSILLTAMVTSSAGTPAGDVTFTAGGVTLGTVPLQDGTAAFSTSALTVGTHTITAVYTGASNFTSSTSPAYVQTVGPAPTTLQLQALASPVTYGTVTVISALVTAESGSPGGSVALYRNNSEIGVGTLTNGVAQFSQGVLPAGVHTFTATYSGATNYQSTTSANLVHQISKAPVQVVLTSSANPAHYGAAFTLEAQVTTPVGSPYGTVSFFIDDSPVATVTLAEHKATLQTLAGATGVRRIHAVYSGDANFQSGTSAPLTQEIAPAHTTTSLIVEQPTAHVGDPTRLVINVTSAAGAPDGTVTLLHGEAVLANIPLVGGQAAIHVSTLPPGPHLLTASYGGSVNFAPSQSGPASLQVEPAQTNLSVTVIPNPAIYGQIVTVTGLLSSPAGIPPGELQFSLNSEVLAEIPLVDGQAVITFTALNPGSGLIHVTYAGQGHFAPASAADQELTVNKQTTALTLSSSAPLINEGTSVTLTAALASNGGQLPTGTVTFADASGDVLGNASLTAGTAVLVYTPSARGPHNLRASYEETANSLGSTSNLLFLDVNALPNAANDWRMVQSGQMLEIPVLENDHDLDGDPLSVISVSPPVHGSVALNPDSTLRYLAPTQFEGEDSFTYTISDGRGGEASARVALLVAKTIPSRLVFPPLDATGITTFTAGGLYDISIVIPHASLTDVAPADEIMLELFQFADAPAPGEQVPGANFRFGDLYFRLKFSVNGVVQPAPVFAQPLLLTLTYPESVNVQEGEILHLHYWNELSQTWLADGIVIIHHEPEQRVLGIELYHLTDFALYIEAKSEAEVPHRMFMPMTIR